LSEKSSLGVGGFYTGEKKYLPCKKHSFVELWKKGATFPRRGCGLRLLLQSARKGKTTSLKRRKRPVVLDEKGKKKVHPLKGGKRRPLGEERRSDSARGRRR